MSVTPFIKTPNELKDFSLKEFKAKFFKLLKKMALKHFNEDNAVPFYMNVAAGYKDSSNGFLMVFGKIKPWQKHARESCSKDEAMRGYCFATKDEKTGLYKLNLMPVAGKIKTKEALVKKEMKTVVPAAKLEVSILKGEFKENPDLENKVEAMEETPDSALPETASDELVQDELLNAEQAEEQQEEQLTDSAKNLEDNAARIAAMETIKAVQKEAQALQQRLKDVKDKIIAADTSAEAEETVKQDSDKDKGGFLGLFGGKKSDDDKKQKLSKLEKILKDLKGLKEDVSKLGGNLTQKEDLAKVADFAKKMNKDIKELEAFANKKLRGDFESRESLKASLENRMKEQNATPNELISEWTTKIEDSIKPELEAKFAKLMELYSKA